MSSSFYISALLLRGRGGGPEKSRQGVAANDGGKKDSAAARHHGVHIAALEVCNASSLDTGSRVGVRNLRATHNKMRFRGKSSGEQWYRGTQFIDVQEA
jgi:hypothetical protein